MLVGAAKNVLDAMPDWEKMAPSMDAPQ